MRIRRLFPFVSRFMSQLCGVVVKTVVTSLVLGVSVISIMHYMGVPVPSVHDLLGGLSRLAHALS